MRHFLASTVSILVLVSPSISFAEAGATEILEEMFDLYQSEGTQLTIGEKIDKGGYSEWRDVMVSGSDGEFVAKLPWIRVKRNLLGGHTMTLADAVTFDIAADSSSDFPGMSLAVGYTGFEAQIAGTKGAREFNGGAEAVSIRTADMSGLFGIDAVLNKMTFEQLVSAEGDTRRAKSQTSIESLTATYVINQGDQRVETVGSAGQLTTFVDIPVTKLETFESDIVQFGNVAVSYSLSDGDFKTVSKSPFGNMDLAAKFKDSGVDFVLDNTKFLMKGTSQGVDYSFNMPALGLPPMDAQMESFDMEMSAPMKNMDVAKPAVVKMGMDGLVVGETAWAMIDPEKTIPRDPASLDISISGMMKWLEDFSQFDPNNPPDAMPIEFETAKVEALNLSVGGAELITGGDFKINNSTMPPQAVGALDASLIGGQTLVNKLVALGLVDQAQAFAVMGMAMMFATKGDQGDDHLKTTIELIEGGGIKANGVQIK